jgi:hypothetical protein
MSCAKAARASVAAAFAAMAALSLLLPPAALAQSSAPPVPVAENQGPNAAIVRRASGAYRYEALSDGRLRGEERFQLFVHPDGSRTLMVWHDLFARNAQFSVMLRNGSNFLPLEAFVSYWNGGSFKGSAHFRVQGAQLAATSSGQAGVVTQLTDLPKTFSIGTHPVAADGWHTAGYDAARGGVQALTFYSLEASTDLTKPVLGTLRPLSVERIGTETVEVPAGRFEAERWRLAGVNDLWIVGPDRLVVKSVIAVRDLQYVLTSLDRQ